MRFSPLAPALRLPALLLGLALAAGCSDAARTPASPSAPDTPDTPPVAAVEVPSVEAQIDALFPTGLRSAARARWAVVKRHYGTGTDARRVELARRLMFELADWTIRQEPKLETGSMLAQYVATSTSPAVTQLIASMFAYVFPSLPAPPVTLTGDAVIGVVLPNQATTIVTPAELAGVAFPAGSVQQPMILVIQETANAAALYAAACSGPLPTTLCQYPLFYEFHPYPYQILLQPARAGVCVATSGPRAPAGAVMPRLRLAHPAPVPSAVLGYVHEGVEVLPHADVDDFLECDDVSFTPPVLSSIENATVRNGLLAMAKAAGTVWRSVAPKPLHAYDAGGGGEFLAFSSFNALDTLVVPTIADLQIQSPFSFGRGIMSLPADTMTIEYDSVNVASWTYGNAGTAAAGASSYRYFLSPDTAITSGDTPLGIPFSSPPLGVGASATAFPYAYMLPHTLVHGVHWVGPLLDQTGMVAEGNESNNFVSQRTVLVYPNTTFETYPGGATTCTPECTLSTQYGPRGMAFNFTPSVSSPPVWPRIVHTGHGYSWNREATAPSAGVAPLPGYFIMSFTTSVRSVRFQLRGPEPAFVPTVEAEDWTNAVITPAATVTTDGIWRTYTYTVSAPAGVNFIKIHMTGGTSPASYVDNVIVRP